ncbi:MULTISPECIES: DUF1007 family protein [unclassified Halomonas]|nr:MULTISPECIES: DUF1007 family protein [unclassified Halomonas]
MGLVTALLPALVQAHPHGWVDLGVRVIIDEQGQVEALHQRWRMDPFYSLVILEELGSAQGNDSLDARLDQLGLDIRNNLAPQHYYTEVTHAGERLALGEVNDYTVMERDGRVEFIFLLPLAQPVALGEEALRYQIFDPSYYIELLHEEEGDTPRADALVVSGDHDCTTQIVPADPDPELVMQAAMLDVTDQAEPGLGRYFAETGVVKCGS